MHANGDAAIDQMLRAVGTAHDKYGPGERRHTLIHGQYIRQDQLQRMAELEMTASLFPMHTFYWGGLARADNRRGTRRAHFPHARSPGPRPAAHQPHRRPGCTA